MTIKPQEAKRFKTAAYLEALTPVLLESITNGNFLVSVSILVG